MDYTQRLSAPPGAAITPKDEGPYFEDVRVGFTLELKKPPITRLQIAKFAGASRVNGLETVRPPLVDVSPSTEPTNANPAATKVTEVANSLRKSDGVETFKVLSSCCEESEMWGPAQFRLTRSSVARGERPAADAQAPISAEEVSVLGPSGKGDARRIIRKDRQVPKARSISRFGSAMSTIMRPDSSSPRQGSRACRKLNSAVVTRPPGIRG